ncbi:MAG TPA: ABC transporter ATP-binding protein, partial [Alphaproteobacteria bacterium]|nr:ABC transporter ATP-binding protein [Alphaproteobacteria bacterium]
MTLETLTPQAAPVGDTKVLEVENLSVSYPTRGAPFLAVRNASFFVERDEVFGLVGESGSGKSTLCMAVLRLLAANVTCTADRLTLGGTDLLSLKPSKLRQLRWTRLSYIPQGSMGVLNPVMRIRDQFLDTMLDHSDKGLPADPGAHIEAALAGVNLRPLVLDQYPHELSGGMKQRVCIALSMLLEPELIVA